MGNLVRTDRIVLDIVHCRTYIVSVRRRKKAGNPQLAVAYLRVSTEDQNLGTEAQRASITAWARRNGVEVLSWHEDRASGGVGVDDRPGLLNALETLRGRHAGILVAAKRDRIARDVVVAATVEQMARDAGAQVVTADGVAVEDTPEGALMRGLMDLFAQYERAVIKARTKAALAVKKRNGERFSRRAPLGFGFVGGRLVEDEGERATLQRVREMRAKGLSIARVVGVLNGEGSTCRGGRWHATTLSRVLRRAS